MKIIHIRGTACSGKSHIIKELEHLVDGYWDVKMFYQMNKVIKSSGEMDWDIYRKVIPELPENLINFLNSAEVSEVILGHEPIVFIESSSNLTVEEILSDYSTTVINLVVPEDDELKRRAKLSNLSEENVLSFKFFYKKRHSEEQGLTIEQAIAKIKDIINAQRSKGYGD